MGLQNLVLLLVTLLLVSGLSRFSEATRILDEEEEQWITRKDLIFHQAVKGPVPPSGPNGCTYIPGQGGAPCTSQRTFAGHAMAPPHHAYPELAASFGVATAEPQ